MSYRMHRRLFTGAVLAAPWMAGAQTDPLAGLLRAGACTVLLRHAQTEAGTGDPPGVQLEVCSTQRNLNDDGKAQARRIGQWFTSHGLKPAAVRSSPWCRCKDTANLAFGQHTVWQALNAPPDDRDRAVLETGQLRKALGLMPAGRFEVWVTHQGNIINLMGGGVAMGEAVILDTQGKLVARSTFA